MIMLLSDKWELNAADAALCVVIFEGVKTGAGMGVKKEVFKRGLV